MNLAQKKISVLACLSAAAFVAATAFSQMAGSHSQNPVLKKDHIVAPTANANESCTLENLVELSQPADAQQRAVAARFRMQATPSVRATYFRSVLEDPDFRFKRWDLRILEATVVDGTTRVKVRAMPIVMSRFAAITSINGCLDETYELKDDSLTILKTDPPVDPNVAKVFSFDGD